MNTLFGSNFNVTTEIYKLINEIILGNDYYDEAIGYLNVYFLTLQWLFKLLQVPHKDNGLEDVKKEEIFEKIEKSYNKCKSEFTIRNKLKERIINLINTFF